MHVVRVRVEPLFPLKRCRPKQKKHTHSDCVELGVLPSLSSLLLDSNRFHARSQFPKLKQLRVLTLSNNNIGELPSRATRCPVCSNPAPHVDALEPLLTNLATSFPALSFLSLLGNGVCPHLSATSQQCSIYRQQGFCVGACYSPRQKLTKRAHSHCQAQETKASGLAIGASKRASSAAGVDVCHFDDDDNNNNNNNNDDDDDDGDCFCSVANKRRLCTTSLAGYGTSLLWSRDWNVERFFFC